DFNVPAVDHPVRAGAQAQHPVPGELLAPVLSYPEPPTSALRILLVAQGHINAPDPQFPQAPPQQQQHHQGSHQQRHEHHQQNHGEGTHWRPRQAVCPVARSRPRARNRACSSELCASARAWSTSISEASSADSASTLTPSPVTDRNPPCTAAVMVSLSGVVIFTIPPSTNWPSIGS